MSVYERYDERRRAIGGENRLGWRLQAGQASAAKRRQAGSVAKSSPVK